jgi:hypothetical protein
MLLLLLACATDGDETGKTAGTPHLSLTPDALEFGDVGEGSSKALHLHAENTGDADLHLGTPTILGSAAYTVTTPDSLDVAPGATADLLVTFAPTGEGALQALIVVPSDDPQNPSLEVQASGFGIAAALRFDPAFLDLGTLNAECTSEDTFTLINDGETPATVASVDVTDPDGAFTVDAQPDVNGSLPWTLGPRESRVVRVTFDAALAGTYGGTLAARTSADGEPAAQATLSATELPEDHVTDTFVADGGPVDVVWSVQYNGSYNDIGPLEDGFPAFLDTLDDLGVEYQMAVVVTMDGCIAGDAPFFDWTQSRDDQMDIFHDMTQDTTAQHGLIIGEEAISHENTDAGGCNEGLVRDDARLAVVGYTSIGDNHPDRGWVSYAYDIQHRKENIADAKIHGIVEDIDHGCGMGAHSLWQDAVEYTGGVWYPICDDIPTSLQGIAEALAEPQVTFPLSEAPQEDTLVVTLNGTATDAWTYDADANAITLEDAPSLDDEIAVAYDAVPVCP